MKRFLCSIFIGITTVLSGSGEVTLCTLDKGATLHIDGNPMLIIGGELGNSSASSEEDIARNLAKCARMNLNTVLVPAYWDLIEPQEGQFDFTLPDAVLREARKNGLKVVFLWFGAWKNSMSCYAPEWVKSDWKRFPRAKTAEGKPLEILSAFNENVFKADSTAFINLLTHLDKTDHDNTVLMVQIENEIGMLESARDHSVAADSTFAAGVPEKLYPFLRSSARMPALNSDNLGKTGAAIPISWDDAFGGLSPEAYEAVISPSPEADEAFMAWHYGRYVGRLAKAGKKVLNRPFYVNAAMNSRGRKPGEYPSAGPLAHLKDIWKTAAPDVAMLSPDLYDNGFTGWADKYAMPDNPLFIPEIRRSGDNPAQALYAFGEHNAVGFSPFSIENGSDDPSDRSVIGFAKLREWEPLLLALRTPRPSAEDASSPYADQVRGEFTPDTWGVYFDMDSVSRVLPTNDDALRITASHFFTLPWDPRATDGSRWPAGGAVIARISPMEYLIIGTGVVVKFEGLDETADHKQLGEDGFATTGKPGKPGNTTDNTDTSIGGSGASVASAPRCTPTTYLPGRDRVGILSCDVLGADLKRIRRLSGDETHQGRHVRISPDDFTILHVRLYRYR